MSSADLLEKLPVETLACVLRCLSEDDLRSAAGTSRRLRMVAFDNAGLCLRFRHEMHFRDPGQMKQNTLRDVIDHARSRSLPIDLAVDCFFLPKTEQTAFVAACLTDALPHVVKLSVIFFRGLPPDVHAALRQPAPHLRELRIRGSPDKVLDGAIPPTALLPAEFLAGSAPRLAKLELHDLFLIAPAPMDMFKQVRDLALIYTSAIPRLDIAAHFPSVRALEIRCERCPILPGDADAPPLDFRGLAALDKLTLAADRALMLELDKHHSACPRDIPLVRRYCDATNWIASVRHLEAQQSSEAKMDMRIRRSARDQAEVALACAARKLCRVYWFKYEEEVGADLSPSHCPLLTNFCILAARLAYVRLDTRFIPELLGIGCALPALRRLRLDLDGEENAIWPPYHEDPEDELDGVDFTSAAFDDDSEALYDLPCPALEVLVIVSPEDEGDDAAVSAREVAHLGRALGQAARAPVERAKLELRGVSWEGHAPQDLLRLVFSSVALLPAPTRDPDGSLWDFCFNH